MLDFKPGSCEGANESKMHLCLSAAVPLPSFKFTPVESKPGDQYALEMSYTMKICDQHGTELAEKSDLCIFSPNGDSFVSSI